MLLGAIFALKNLSWKDRSDDDFQNSAIYLMKMFNQFIFNKNKDLAFQITSEQTDFIELVLQSKTLAHLELLLEKELKK